MNKNPTPEEVRASIVPKSDQMNAEDCAVTGPVTVTVADVRRGSKEQQVVIDLEGRDRPFKPCKTCRRILVALWSDDARKWKGQRMTIYTDPAVKWKGVCVGGLRISHVTGIDEPKTLLLTQTRGQMAEHVIQPLPSTPAVEPTATLTPDECAFAVVAKVELEDATTIEELEGYGHILKNKSKPVQEFLRPVYAKRQSELQEG